MPSMNDIAARFQVAEATPAGTIVMPVERPPVDPMRQLEEQEAQQELSEEASNRREEAEMRRSLRRMRMMAEQRALMAALAPPQESTRPDQGIATAIATMVRASQQQNQLLIGEMQRMRQDMAQQQQSALIEHISTLGHRIEEVAAARGSGTETGLNSLTESLNQVKLFKTVLDEINPPPIQIDPTVTREQALKEMAIGGEIEIQRAREQRRRRELEINHERELADRQLASDRINKAFDGFAQIATPIVQGLTEFVASRMAGQQANGAAPGIAAPAQSNGHDPHLGMADWACPGCGVTNWSPPGTTDAVCANCNNHWSLSPQDDAAEGMIGDGGVEDPFGEFVNV